MNRFSYFYKCFAPGEKFGSEVNSFYVLTEGLMLYSFLKFRQIFFCFFALSALLSIVSPFESIAEDDLVPLDAVREEAEVKRDLAHEAKLQDLLRALSSPDEKTRIDAGINLLKTVKLGDTSLLSQTLKRGNNIDKQLFIIDALSKLGDRRAGEALQFETRHGELDSRRAATSALGKLNTDWPIPVLVRTLRQEKDHELRKRAASALGTIGSTQAIYAIRTSLSKLEDSAGAKNSAYYALDYALGQIDPERVDTNIPAGMRLTLYYKGMRYFFYHPTIRKGASSLRAGLRPWLLTCFHDEDLAASDTFTVCWKAAKRRQMAVLVPTFDNINYPDYGNFNIRGERADQRLLELIEFLSKQVNLSVRELYMFGYGAGGDFAHRFAISNPKRIARIAFEANEFTKPDSEYMYPRGIGKNPLAPDIEIDMYPVLKTDMMIIQRKESPTFKDAQNFAEAYQNYADIHGIRARLATKKVDVKYEVWGEAEKYLFGFDYY
ncbi:MAG TPA: HEAT repeat domain-containing protein [Oligoflexia bacterium]|nr:HEAT repeat domain-containing protein [Oligoflexia bacterium]HMP47437.1 HEAT repeat domain-containing protein [Oligoflexia bacterium]